MSRSIKLATRAFVVATMVVMGCGVWALTSTPIRAATRMCNVSDPEHTCPCFICPDGSRGLPVLCTGTGCVYQCSIEIYL